MAAKSILRVRWVTGLSLVLGMAGCVVETAEPLNETGPAAAPEPPTESAPTGKPRLRTVYVPAYSHLQGGDKRKHYLSCLLSVRNVDSSAVITLNHVDYFDTSGHRVRRYLSEPRPLRPLETAEFAVETLDDTGGSGANFLVYWEGPSDAHSLLTETVMWGNAGASYISFTSRGVELDRRPDPKTFMVDTPPATSKP